MHLNLTEPLQHRWTLLQREGWVCGWVQPATRSQSLHSAAVQYRTVAHSSQQLMCRKLLGARAHRSKVLGVNWPRLLSKNYIMCCHAPTQNKWNFCAAAVWKTTQIICDIEIDMEQPAGGQHIYPTGMGFHRKIMRLSNLLRTVIVRSECKEARFNMTLTFLAGESLKQSHRFISPVAVWPVCPIVSQLNWKRCSMQVQQ